MFLSEGFKLGFAEGIISMVTVSHRMFVYLVAGFAKMMSFDKEDRVKKLQKSPCAGLAVCEHFHWSTGEYWSCDLHWAGPQAQRAQSPILLPVDND